MGMTRKLAAIISADVVGYSRLMGADEAGTLAALKKHRRELIDPKIAEHEGRIVKTTGDGLLIEFPSVVEAVQCAVEMQRAICDRNADVPAVHRIEFRVGINLGDIIIDGDDIHGDGVNVAARLEGLAEPNGICVSRVVRDQVRDKLDVAFEDLGEQQVKNIARPLRVFRVAQPAIVRSTASAKPALALPDKPSIAVLPFENLSGDPEQQYFSDGITDDIITEVSRFRQLFVIARNSSFVFRGKQVDVAEIGRRLGVHYLVEGSVRRVDDRIRINVQLVDTVSGAHVWADRYDRDMKDLYAVQDELAHTIAATLTGCVESAETRQARRKPTNNLTAYDCYLRGVEHHRRLTVEDMARSREMFERAIELDPEFALLCLLKTPQCPERLGSSAAPP
jgi:adenylate cyclase